MNDKIYTYFDELIPNPKCELNYATDFQLLIAVMLSAQTTDKRVNLVTKVLFEKYKTISELASANINDISNIIKTIGTFRRKSEYTIAIAKEIESIGYVPNDRLFIESLPGVGRKTCNVVLSEIYNVPCIAVDTHVERVSKRLNLVRINSTVEQVERKLSKIIPAHKLNKMHHQILLFGRYYCKAKNPNCQSCQLNDICKYYKNNIQKNIH